jgi:hypothetical protein
MPKYLASAISVSGITNRWSIERPNWITCAHFASDYAQLIVIGRTTVTFVTDYARFASTLAIRIALYALRTKRVALTINTTHLVFAPIKTMLAFVAILTTRVTLAIIAVSTMARQLIERMIEVTLFGQAIARTSFNNENLFNDKLININPVVV